MNFFVFKRKTENGKRKTVYLLFLLAALSCFACGRAPQAPPQQARVVQVLDGDTLVLEGGARVRLLGIDAPEMEREGRPAEFLAHKAKAYLAQLTQGKVVRLEYGPLRYDHYGRLLAHIVLGDGTLVEAALLRQGLAHVYLHPPNVRYREVLLAAQQEAMAARRGVWLKALNQDESFYLANRHTLRFHRPHCPHAAKIAPANRVKIVSLKEAYLQGFSPCRSCKP
ncbi:MAG: nuclease [Deltaproteobacteria bacterium]|nr:MAG: nuclease [Deltaproteobacteria bacterium]